MKSERFRKKGVFARATIYIQSQTEYFLSTRVFGFSEMFRGDDDPFESYEGASAIKIMQQQGTIPDRLLLIVVESWGEPQNQRVQDALLEPLRGLEFHEWQEGLFRFSGATVAAEFRELCDFNLKHFNLKHVKEGFDVCLPQLLKRDGFATRAMHGATGNVYDRHVWYPRIGFEEQVFFENRQWPRRCHSFPGACDLDMFGELELFFGESGKRFMYWLTLNSHSIYDSRDIFEDHFNCKEFDIDEGESCRNLKLHAQFFHGLAKQLQSPVFHGTHVMLVSDHEPRILNQNEMNRYFHAGEIPWVSFTLR